MSIQVNYINYILFLYSILFFWSPVLESFLFNPSWAFSFFLNNSAVSTEWIYLIYLTSLLPLIIQFGSSLCYYDRLNKRCLFPNPPNLWLCYLPWQKGLCWCIELRMAKRGERLYYSGGPKVINHKRLHKREGGESNAKSGCEGGRGGWKGRLERCEVRHSWRSLGNGLSPRASERTGLQFQFSLDKTHPGLPPSRTIKEYMCLVLSYFVCGLNLKAQIGYSGRRKPVQLFLPPP